MYDNAGHVEASLFEQEVVVLIGKEFMPFEIRTLLHYIQTLGYTTPHTSVRTATDCRQWVCK